LIVEYGELGPDHDSAFASVHFFGTSNINVCDRLCLSVELWFLIVEEGKIYCKKMNTCDLICGEPIRCIFVIEWKPKEEETRAGIVHNTPKYKRRVQKTNG